MPLPNIASPVYRDTFPGSKKDFEYRPMLVGEEKVILMAIEDKKLDAVKVVDSISQVLRAVTFGKIEFGKLPSVDIDWLLLKLRIKSKGSKVSLTFNCLKNKTDDDGNEVMVEGMPVACGRSKVVAFDLEQVQITDGPSSLRINITDKIGMQIGLPAYDLTRRITEKVMRQNKNLSDLSDMVIYECIETIWNGDDVQTKKDFTLEEFIDFYNQMPITAKQQIEEFFNNMPKLVGRVQYECACGKYKDELTVEGVQSFLG